MSALHIGKKQEEIKMKELNEKEIMGQVICYLVEEKLLNPEEQIRFLSILREES